MAGPIPRAEQAPATRHFDLDRRLAALLHVDFRLPSVDYSTFLRATRLMTGDQRQVDAVFQRCVFHVLFNNRDDHARNASYRMNRDWYWQLSPCYDLSFNSGPWRRTSDGGHGRAPVARPGAIHANRDRLK
ncbi:HipA domain-containing protein [Duganella sp. HH101]|uniref:HipA domain-containing protein n=1 Tax=Duganella sp. HH101 TaxID=1781066 RepID=UPI0008FCDC7F|nr:HipA domain-containing protein [Duganella sp. HH101]